jgi:hypothetical protein
MCLTHGLASLCSGWRGVALLCSTIDSKLMSGKADQFSVDLGFDSGQDRKGSVALSEHGQSRLLQTPFVDHFLDMNHRSSVP